LPKNQTKPPKPNHPPTFNKYLLSPTAAWFWTTIILTIAASTIALTIPEDSQFILARNILGFILVLWLPGYTFTKALYPTKLPITTKKENVETIERIAKLHNEHSPHHDNRPTAKLHTLGNPPNSNHPKPPSPNNHLGDSGGKT
jgi:hypothetical protein